jgi:hypothetical protein
MIKNILIKYHSQVSNDEHHRYKSWEHCFRFFQRNYNKLHMEDILDHSSLQMGFYLASWGMLRGSSFLFAKDYLIHTYFLKDVVADKTNICYFAHESKRYLEPQDFMGIDELIGKTKLAYSKNIKSVNGGLQEIHVTDTLASKILLGVYGNVPAYDRYFKEALSLFAIRTSFDEQSLLQLVDFYKDHFTEFDSFRTNYRTEYFYYPPMKLIDMFFFQIGLMMDDPEKHKEELEEVFAFVENYRSTKKYKMEKSSKPIFKRERKNIGLTDEIRRYILTMLNEAKEKGENYLDIRSGDIHKAMGLKDRLPPVCNAMESLHLYRYEILHDTPSGKSSTKLIRYYL